MKIINKNSHLSDYNEVEMKAHQFDVNAIAMLIMRNSVIFRREKSE